MLMLYFSGTGNSKFIATLFSEQMNAACYSIEESVDFSKLISEHEKIAFCYPIYGSCVPRIMREFLGQYAPFIQQKKIIIFCTQLMFSGDGARALVRLLPKDYGEVIYAEHFNMPNNICNVKLFPIKNGREIDKQIQGAQLKMKTICHDINAGIIKKRGFHVFSTLIGKTQSAFWPTIEEINKSSIKVDHTCTKCGLCVTLCPMKNLSLENEGILQHDRCMICYRCVNACRKGAITAMIHKKPKKQYKGI